MEQRYNLMKNNECIGTYPGFQVEMLYMKWAEKWLKNILKIGIVCIYNLQPSI